MSGFKVEENESIYGTKIKAIGVGGGGGNMINRLITEYAKLDIDLITANTDAQALNNSKAYTKIRLGEKLTRGLGAGMKPEVGRDAADESYSEIKDSLESTDIVFVAAGLGGGTGTGAAPVVARAAKESGALAVAVVTTPFGFEGKKRMKLALEGLEELRKECDSIVVVPNERLRAIMDRRASIDECYRAVDSVLARAVGGISTMILGKGYINIDFADVRTVMSHRGMAILGVGEASGENAAVEAVHEAIQSPLLGDVNIDGAKGVLIYFRHHPTTPLADIEDAAMIIRDLAHEDADIIFGHNPDDSIDEDRVEAMIVATGFDMQKEMKTDEAKQEEIKSSNAHLNLRLRVSGDDTYSDEQLEIPAYLRHQLD